MLQTPMLVQHNSTTNVHTRVPAGYTGKSNAVVYDTSNTLSSAVLGVDSMRERAMKRAKGNVLLTAVGTGLELVALDNMLENDMSSQISSVTAIDASESMLAIAKQRAGRVGAALLQGDIQALPFDDGSFDTVVDVFGLCELSEPKTALSEMCRVLKKPSRSEDGGVANLVEHTRSDVAPLLAAYQDAVAPAVTRTARGCQWNQRVAVDAVDAGFKLIQYKPRLLGLLAEFQLTPSVAA